MKNLPSSFAFWGCIGFEDRSVSVLKDIIEGGGKPSKINIFCSKESVVALKMNVKLFKAYVDDFQPINIYYNNPVDTADIFIQYFENVKKSKISSLVLDITTFTREWILIILAISKMSRFKNIKIYVAYNYAASMSNDWLSLRPRQLRTVLGYPGIISPSKKNHLVLILGHEIERALSIIDEIEPAYITVITGSREGSVTKEMCDRNNNFKDYIMNNYCKISDHKQINVRDFLAAKESIQCIIESSSGYNIIIAPLNTKISTLAAGSVALENKNIQICYMPMELYNSKNFSTPSNSNVVFQL